MPVIERSEAEVTVDKQTELVQSFIILEEPVPEESAWSDSFVLHKLYDPNDPDSQAQLKNGTYNVINYTDLNSTPIITTTTAVYQNMTTRQVQFSAYHRRDAEF
jgi:hypothetical protein